MNGRPLKPQSFSPSLCLKLSLGAAVLLSLTMALWSDFDRHPDEIHHFEAAKYYTNHFLPPEIGDPAVRASYSVYGVSYLNYHWVEYFAVGKFMLLLSPVLRDQLTAARLFSVFLFFGLAAFFTYRARSDEYALILSCVLLVSPQIWYVFSYVNNDAFALFVSMVAAYQLGYPTSRLNDFLQSDSFGAKISGGVLVGLLAGLLLIVKPNYWAFLVFAALWLVFSYPLRMNVMKKFAFISLIAIAVLTFRVGLDLYVNGETNYAGASYVSKFFGNLENQGKLLAYQESVAEYPFRPSTVENDLANTHPDLNLRKKGVSFSEMLFEKGWLRLSSQSFFGVYGYMNIYAKSWLYAFFFMLTFVFGAYLFYAVIKSRDRKSLAQLAITALGIFLTVFVSMTLSWVYAFQPQGRYLFPALAMCGLFVYANRRHFDVRVVNLYVAAMFLLSVFSFVAWGLRRINLEIIAS